MNTYHGAYVPCRLCTYACDKLRVLVVRSIEDTGIEAYLRSYVALLTVDQVTVPAGHRRRREVGAFLCLSFLWKEIVNLRSLRPLASNLSFSSLASGPLHLFPRR